MEKNKQQELEELCEPLIKWLNENMHPHSHIYITTTSAELSEGTCAFYTEDYVKG